MICTASRGNTLFTAVTPIGMLSFFSSGSHSGLLLARRRDEGVHGLVRQAGQVLGPGDQPGAASGRARRAGQVGALGQGAKLHRTHDRIVG